MTQNVKPSNHQHVITDTMLTSPDFVTDNERQHILNVAPGEGNRPMSIFRDKY